jgi:hypothetical protein
MDDPARAATPDVEQHESVPVPAPGQVLLRTVPAAAVLTVGLPVQTSWGLDGNGNARGGWLPFAPADRAAPATGGRGAPGTPRPASAHVDTYDPLTQRWDTRDFFLVTEFTPWKDFDATAVRSRAQAIGSAPHWVRTTATGDVLWLPLQRMNRPCPMPAPAKPTGIGIAHNSTVGPTRPPARLHDHLDVSARHRCLCRRWPAGSPAQDASPRARRPGPAQ